MQFPDLEFHANDFEFLRLKQTDRPGVGNLVFQQQFIIPCRSELLKPIVSSW